ncbi:MAG: diguanylate cyclase domain-containing protein [Candidatus Neoclostridium sp.]
MLDNYTAIVILSCLTIFILGILVYENARFDKATKRKFYVTYVLLLIATLSEWAGIALNGAPAWTIWLHRVVKCIDYVVTPVAGVCFALQVLEKKEQKKHVWIAVILAANALLQIISLFTGWTFYVDANNEYRHGPLYIVYTVIYCISILDILISFLVYSKKFRRQNRPSLYAIIVLACIGIAFQELGGGNIRTACLSLAFCSALLFIHYNEFTQQKNDDKLNYQKKLAETDVLTGMRSRYSYVRTLDEYRKEPMPHDLVVYSVDINGLKSVNDNSGHASGDRLILDAAECISETFGQYGKCFRIGGDEFIAIVNAEKSKTSELRRTLCEAAEKRDGLSLSSGYAAAVEYPGYSIEELINVADKMMYADKENYYRDKKDEQRTV